MPSGGARARSGPPPDPTALRRDRQSDRASWTHLRRDAREGLEPPAWPLSRARPRELALWAREWQRPQAAMWDANGQTLMVALYVRAVVVAEGPHATATDRTVILRYLDDLGISNAGLARNRWVIDDDPGAQPGQLEERQPDARPSAKDRLRLIG